MIDVLIPAINDDIYMLNKTIYSVKRNVKDVVNEIFIISPQDDNIKKLCSENKVTFINEIEYIGFGKNDFEIKNRNRNGWLYQQLLKMNGDKISSTNNFLVIDADHILLKPHEFCSNDSFIFFTSKEYHLPYFMAIDKLFKQRYKKKIQESFISDKMIFNKRILSEMKHEIEEIHEKEWFNAIFDSYDKSSFCGFSEFETYGTYILSKYPSLVRTQDCNRLMCFEKRIENMSFNEIKTEFSQYDSITLHRYAK